MWPDLTVGEGRVYSCGSCFSTVLGWCSPAARMALAGREEGVATVPVTEKPGLLGQVAEGGIRWLREVNPPGGIQYEKAQQCPVHHAP